MRTHSAVKTVVLLAIVTWFLAGSPPTGASSKETANDTVVIRFPDGIDVPWEVQELLLQRVTESIRYVEDFFGYAFPRRIEYQFIESRYWGIGSAGYPNIVRDPWPVPTSIEDPSLYRPFNPHEVVHLVNHAIWHHCAVDSMDEGFAWLVQNLYLSLPLHYEASGLLALGELPPLQTLLLESSQVSRFRYFVASRGNSSFLGFLYERFGHRSIIRLHRGLAEICGEGRFSDNLISLVEKCTSTPIAQLEVEWHKVLRAIQVHPRYLTALRLYKEYDKADLLRLVKQCEWLDVEIDPAFMAEVRSLNSDIWSYVNNESLTEEELRARIEEIVKWAEEIRRGISDRHTTGSPA